VGFFSVQYLGHCVGNQFLQTKPDMVNKILQASKPADKKQLQSSLGLIGYYRKFTPNFADTAVPLTNLTKKDQPSQLKGGEAQNRALETLKSHTVNPPILRLPIMTGSSFCKLMLVMMELGPYFLWSPYGIGQTIIFSCCGLFFFFFFFLV